MNAHFPAPTTYEERLKAEYKARQARFAAVARKVRQDPKTRPVLLLASNGAMREADKKPEGPPPLWSFTQCRFDDHILAYRRHQEDCFRTFGSPSRVYVQKRALEMGFSFRQIASASRKRGLVEARQLIMWELKNEVRPDISLPEIGRIFGGRDHSTVLHAIRRVDAAKARGE